MADEDDRDMAEASSDDSTDNASESEPELMVSTRERRKTAGNRYSATIGQEQEAAEEEDDDVALLFAEGAEGEDEEYNSYEGDDDADMSSSDDNDDQGPNVAADDLEGEKELEKQAKVERQRKRKADLALTTMAAIKKKKPKIDPTSLHRAPDRPKPSKRKERVSWLPDQDLAPGRTSLRKQTIAHREVTHARLKENEKQRLKLKAVREKKEKQRQAEAPKEMTQEDRLEEAARVERRNAKSLNRWEAMEKKRQEEQAAKLAALKDRKLDGAVITTYSCAHLYRGHKSDRTSPGPSANGGIHEPKKRGRKPKALLEQLAAAKEAQNSQPIRSPATLNPNAAVTSTTAQAQAQNEPRPAVASPTASHQSSNLASGADAEINMTDTSKEVEKISPPKPHEEDLQEQNDERPPNRPPNETQSLETNQTQELNNENSGQKLDDGKPHDLEQNINDEPRDGSQPQSSEDELKALKDSDQTQSSETLHDETVPERPTNMNKATSGGDDTPVRPEPEGITPSGSTDQLHVETEIKDEVIEKHAQRPKDGEDLPEKVSQNVQPLNPVDAQGQHVTEGEHESKLLLESQRDESQAADEPQSAAVDRSASSQIQSSALSTSLEEEMTSAAPLIEVVSTRNVVVLEKFDQLPSSFRQEFNVFYGTRKTGRPNKQGSEVCPVTGSPAKYKDPATGLGYANGIAYKKLQDLRQQQFIWSGMLGCYVGKDGVAARGVPDGFLE